jgi:hypothetical protein
LRTDSPAAVPRGRAGGSPISGTRSSHGGNLPDTQRKAVDRLFSFIPFENSPVGIWFKAVSQYLSPYDFNPLNINPLKDLIERFVDFEAVRKSQSPQVFISARPMCGRDGCAFSPMTRSPPT